MVLFDSFRNEQREATPLAGKGQEMPLSRRVIRRGASGRYGATVGFSTSGFTTLIGAPAA